MTDTNSLTAEMLEASAAGYASAANVLLQKALNRSESAGAASAAWKAHLTQRILELATAVRVREPSLFARRISWLRRAIIARGADESELQAALESLSTALNEELPDSLKSTIEAPLRLALDMLKADIEPEAAALDASTEGGRLGIAYLTACLEVRSESAIGLVLDALDQHRLTPQRAYTEVLLPAQHEIGQLWHSGDVSISEERMVTETTRVLMNLIANRFSPAADENRTVVAASVAGNSHDIGLRAASDLFRLAGWNSVFLGADMPAADIAKAAQLIDAKLIILSATLTTQIRALSQSIEAIRDAAKGTKILIGGLALKETPALWKQLGADAYAPNVESAVDVGSKLLAAS